MEGDEREEFYNFMKGLGPDDGGELKALEEAKEDYERIRERQDDYNELCKEFSKKLDRKTAKAVKEKAEDWLDDFKGNHKLYGFALKKLGDVSEASPKVARAAAEKYDTMLGRLARHYGISGSIGHDFLFGGGSRLATTLGAVMDGAAEVAPVDKGSAKALLEHSWDWVEHVESYGLRGYVSGELPTSDHRRLVRIIKEAAEKGGGKELIGRTGELLEKHHGNVKRYFDEVSEEYDLAGKFLDGPLDFLEYEADYLGVTAKGWDTRYRMRSKDPNWASYKEDMGRLSELRRDYGKERAETKRKLREGLEGGEFSGEYIETMENLLDRKAEKLREIIDYARAVGRELSGYSKREADETQRRLAECMTARLSDRIDNYKLSRIRSESGLISLG